VYLSVVSEKTVLVNNVHFTLQLNNIIKDKSISISSAGDFSSGLVGYMILNIYLFYF
jgi:hypothetical protein